VFLSSSIRGLTGFKIQAAVNAQNPGISAVHSRIEAGTLKIIGSACPNLVSESQLYQYEEGSDKPAKEYIMRWMR